MRSTGFNEQPDHIRPDLSVVSSLESTETRGIAHSARRDIRDDIPGVGSVLGQYQLRESLGKGRISRTFLAESHTFHTRMTLKMLDVAGFPEEQRLRASLRSEALILARLNHPHIVRVWDYDDQGPFPYVVTEYVAGHALDGLIQRLGVLHPLLAVGLIRQTVEALAHARSRGVVHRDVKPANLMVGHDGVVRLLDFGLAVVVGAGSFPLPSDDDSESGVTGTAAYLAPEQACHPQQVDHRADIYSLGVTLYQALTGKLPFEARSVMEMICRHLRDEPTPPHLIRPEIPQPLSEFVLQMMAKDPEDRCPSYDLLRVELGRVVGDRRLPRTLAESIMRFTPPMN